MGNILFPLAFALTVISLWVPIKFRCLGRTVLLWHISLFFTVMLGLYWRLLQPLSVLFILLYFSLFITYQRYQTLAWARRLLLTAIILMSLLLGFHILPGFHALPLIEESVLSAASLAYANRFNLDKYLVGIAVIGYLHPTLSSLNDWKSILLPVLRAVLIAAMVIFPVGIILGALAPDVKIPHFLPLWILSNLIFTCVTEEAFFRGLLQRNLQNLFMTIKHGPYIAIALIAVFFGLVHFGFGLNYIILATIAGFIYGWVYYKTGKIEAAILTHFGLNLLHLIFFTYPLK